MSTTNLVLLVGTLKAAIVSRMKLVPPATLLAIRCPHHKHHSQSHSTKKCWQKAQYQTLSRNLLIPILYSDSFFKHHCTHLSRYSHTSWRWKNMNSQQWFFGPLILASRLFQFLHVRERTAKVRQFWFCGRCLGEQELAWIWVMVSKFNQLVLFDSIWYYLAYCWSKKISGNHPRYCFRFKHFISWEHLDGMHHSCLPTLCGRHTVFVIFVGDCPPR